MLTEATFVPHLPSTDLARSKNFYGETLGLPIRDETAGHFSIEAGHTSVVVYLRPEPTKAEHTAAGWIVDDIERTVRQLHERGVTFERYPGYDQDDAGIARGDRGPPVAWFTDPDGNILSVMQFPG